MDINELESYRLADAVKFNKTLNKQLWGANEQLLPEVRDKLLAIADDFREFLGIANLEVQDITISGSNAAYTYTDNSDIDLHLIVDLPRADTSEVYRELFDAKKYQYNDQHDFVIGQHDVELYVQNPNEKHVSQGIYSVLNNKWIQVPSRRQPKIDDVSVRSKYEDLVHRIDQAVESGSQQRMDDLAKKISSMRKSGLADTGEFGAENLAFKMLRNTGSLDRLRSARQAAKNQAMSLEERKKKKKKTQWGRFGGMWFPGYHNIGQPSAEADKMTPADIGGESVKESVSNDLESTVEQFVNFCSQQLSIKQTPTIKLRRDPAWSQRQGTFGRYDPVTNTVTLSTANRHPVDVMRTLAHELTHHRQAELGPIPDGAGETGTSFEDSANAMAGRIMRAFAEQHPEYFDRDVIAESSGYIPVTDAEARDPRYSMAITVDIKPGEPRRQAAKLGWKTDAAGKPPQARTNGLVESLRQRLQVIKESQQDLSEEDLAEVAMSPGALKQWASSGAAQNMQAGFEAELIFTGLGGDDEGDMEPDYDEDRTAGSIEDIIDFFSEGPYADLSQRQAQNIRDELTEEYLEWADQQVSRNWSDQKVDYIGDYIDDEDLFDRDAAEEQAREELGDDADAGEIDERVRQMRSDFLDEILENDFDNSTYERAYEQFRDEQMQDFDQYEWLGENERHMSDLASEFGLSWPYMTSTGSEEGFSEYNAELLADELARELGVKTKVSGGYHSTKRDAESWIFEPDSSLDPDDYDDMPVEIVSPPMPLSQALEILPKFFAWAKSNNAYANKTTGFHMSVSMPDHEGGALDYVKLALFLGDEYVLKQFGRSANTYAVSAISKIRDAAGKKLQEDDTNADAVLKNMRSSLNQFAARALAQPSGFGKYTSINPKNNYIEFRSAGGTDYFEDMDQIQNTLLRYARATSIAMDPAAEKPEYARKLYKLLQPTDTTQVTDPKTGRQRTQVKTQGQQDPVWLFAQYAAGELPRQALKSFVRQLQSTRAQKKSGQTSGDTTSDTGLPELDRNGNYRIVYEPSGDAVFQFSASNPDEALEVLSAWRASRQPAGAADSDYTVRPVIARQPGSMPPQSADGEYEIYSRNSRNSIWRFDAEDANAATEALYYWRDYVRQPGTDPDNFGLRRAWPTAPQGGPAQTGTEPEMQQYVIDYALGDRRSTYRVSARSQSEARNILVAKLRDAGADMSTLTTYSVEPEGNNNASNTNTDAADRNMPFIVMYRLGDSTSTSRYRIDAPDQAQARAAFIQRATDLGRRPDEVEIVSVEQLR